MRHVGAQHEPLTEPVFLILTSLAESPKHGYALIKDIESMTEARVRLSTGTLYGALRRLLEDLWIERYATEDISRDKQTYRITSFGRGQLIADLERLKPLIRAAIARLKEA